MKKWLKPIGLTVGTLIVVAGAYWFLNRPKIIEVAGRKVQISQEGDGAPSVIFEAGFEGGIGLEAKLQHDIANVARTLTYERAGIGQSSPVHGSRDAEQIARELHQLLLATRTPSPYVLIGHSAGAIFVRVFARMYPGEVAGIVLLDPATEDFYERMRVSTPAEWSATSDALDKLGPNSGLAGQWRSLPKSFEQARNAWPLPTAPVLMLESTKALGQWPLKTSSELRELHRSQAEMASKIPGVKVRQIEGTDHLNILSSQETSDQISAFVRDLKSRSR